MFTVVKMWRNVVSVETTDKVKENNRKKERARNFVVLK